MKSINFDNPLLLLVFIPMVLLTVVPYVIAIRRGTRAKAPKISLALHLVISAIITLALAGLSTTTVITETNVYVLADVSYSSMGSLDRIDGYIEKLTDGYDTLLTDGGVNISKGERQLITIARAMLSDAPMLILDEATSNVDSRTEIKIQEAMHNLMAGKTCFVIAHRLSTIKNADMIIVLQNGLISEVGNHDELIAKGGFYATLYNSQFK